MQSITNVFRTVVRVVTVIVLGIMAVLVIAWVVMSLAAHGVFRKVWRRK